METAEFVAHFEATFPEIVGGPVLVALSGGRDSVTLLHLLAAPDLDLRLEAAHVHHRLRGAESDGDAEFCSRLCAGLEIPFALLELPSDDGRPATGEAAWRRRRYRALLDHAAARGIGRIATAHHRDDVAEGVVLQLLRGAGPRAMAGIAASTPDGVIRPLLPWGRDDIDGWLAATGLRWREDGSNADVERLRNRVRHRVLPELERAAPRVRSHLVGLAGMLADDEAFMAAELGRRVGFIDPWAPDGGLAVDELAALPRALRGRWLHGQTRRLGIDRTTRRQLELFHRLLDTGTPTAVTVGGRWRLRSARGRLWAEPPSPPPGSTATLTIGQTADLGVPGWRARCCRASDADPTARWRRRTRSDGGIVTVRPAAAGESVADGSGGRRPVRRLLAAALPRHLRPGWPVFCENDMIYWIPGVWQHPDPGDSTDRVVEVIRQ